jgi:hypothetical protein
MSTIEGFALSHGRGATLLYFGAVVRHEARIVERGERPFLRVVAAAW